MVDTSWALVNHCRERAKLIPQPWSGESCGNAVQNHDIGALSTKVARH
jgi:hypothetical protein